LALHEPLARPPLNVLLAEVRAPELARLRRREPWGVESAHDLVGEFALIGSERRRIAPVQSSSDVLLDHPLRASELVGALMQLPHLLEQRLEHLVVYRQERRTLLAVRQPDSRRLGLSPSASSPKQRCPNSDECRSDDVVEMYSVSTRKGGDDYVPAVRTEPDDRGANDNACHPGNPWHELHQHFAQAPIVLEEQCRPELG
jgi:hypothetical protein